MDTTVFSGCLLDVAGGGGGDIAREVQAHGIVGPENLTNLIDGAMVAELE